MQMGVYLRPKSFKERFDYVVDLFPLLGERRKGKAGSLSGGARQMVAMGRALMTDPAVSRGRAGGTGGGVVGTRGARATKWRVSSVGIARGSVAASAVTSAASK